MGHENEQHHNAHAHNGDHAHGGQTVPMLVIVLVLLMVLVGVTVLAAKIHFGAVWLNTAIAFAIAGFKAWMVGTYFMELKWSTPIVRLTAVMGLFFLAIMLGFTFCDYLTRGG